MAFTQEQIRTPTDIGKVTITLTDSESDKIASFELDVLNGNGDVMRVRRGDLIPHLTTQERNQLLAFMDTIRQRAKDQIIP